MGTSSSTLDVGRALRALLSDAPVNEESLNLLLEVSLSNTELERAVPFSVLRSIRHYRTKNFALLLHKCVETIACIAASARNPAADGANRNFQQAAQRMQNALRLLRRMLPLAMESGDTVCEESTEALATTNDNLNKSNTPNAVTNRTTNSATNTTRESNATSGNVNLAGNEVEEGNPLSQNPNDSTGILLASELEVPRNRFTADFVQHFFVDGLACDEDDPERLLPPLEGQEGPLHVFLGCLLVDCCFLRGLTLPAGPASEPKLSSSHCHMDESLLWYPGIGSQMLPTLPFQPASSTNTLGLNNDIHLVRRELLAVLVSFLAYPMFFPLGTPDTVFTMPLLRVESVSLLPTLVASTLNAALSYNPRGSLPYTSHWVGLEEDVVILSARFLCALLCAPPIVVPLVVEEEVMNTENASTSLHTKVQLTHSGCATIHDITEEEARYILTRLQPIVSLKLNSNRTILPDSQRNFLSQDEFMVLLWRLIDLSPKFLAVFAHEKMALSYVLPLVDYALDARRDPTRFPCLHLVLFMLMRLTEVREFCVHCNAPFGESIPFEFDPFVFSYGDLIVLMLCGFLMIRHELIRPLHETCGAVLSNLAPFLTSVSTTAAKKLALLFTSVATRCIALSPAGNTTDATIKEVETEQIVLICVVGAMASVMQYHETGAVNLLAALAERRELIADVARVFAPVEGPSALRARSNSPFLIETLRRAVEAVAQPMAEAMAEKRDILSAIRETALVGILPTPHPIVVKRLYNTTELNEWMLATMWWFLYSCAPPGTYGDRFSVKLLRL